MEIFSIIIQKGGCGKTTTTQALAEILSETYGKRVLCIDTDPQCNLSTVSGVNLMEWQEHNLYTLLREDSAVENCIFHGKYYDVIPGSLLLAYADTEFNRTGKEYFLKERIEHLDYDYVLIDTPPALGLLNIMSLTASSKVLIPTECSFLSMIGLNQLYDTICTVKKYSNHDISISGILMIKYSSRSNINKSVADGLVAMAQKMGTRVFESKIRETVRVKEAQIQMIPLLDWEAGCSALADYREFAKELLGV